MPNGLYIGPTNNVSQHILSSFTTDFLTHSQVKMLIHVAMTSDSTLPSVAEGRDRDRLLFETWAPCSVALYQYHIPLCEFQPLSNVFLSFSLYCLQYQSAERPESEKGKLSLLLLSLPRRIKSGTGTW